ncbi:hypothetical protein Q5P01_024257 [Channa striata]|uniref:Uncharacterized protein n=1 Tax=Channa striata TaxID=64152 RepID=A0AA88LIR3_CHASR|nr:hypothetical protein Q5P01_024257 [Channa striata]
MGAVANPQARCVFPPSLDEEATLKGTFVRDEEAVPPLRGQREYAVKKLKRRLERGRRRTRWDRPWIPALSVCVAFPGSQLQTIH